MPEKSKFSGRCRFLEKGHVVRIIFNLFRPAAHGFRQIARYGSGKADEIRVTCSIGGEDVRRDVCKGLELPVKEIVVHALIPFGLFRIRSCDLFRRCYPGL